MYFGGFCFRKVKIKEFHKSALPPLSILVCARNEAQNLAANVPFLLKQEYPEFEILLVNDGSTDETAAVIDAFSANNPNVRVLHIKAKADTRSGKKQALTTAIAAARYEHLLFIDADCRPRTPYWAQEMAQGLDTGKQIVLGYGSYATVNNNLLNNVIRFETLLTAMQYFGYANRKNPYMGVGRNLGYTKTLFYAQNGFSAHHDVPSGDDDLFVNAAATATTVSCVYTTQSFSVSIPKTTWTDWFLQKKRHISVADRYKKRHQLSLGLFYISQFLPYILVIFLLFSPVFSLISLGVLLVRYLFVGFIMHAGMQRFEEKNLIYWFPVLEIFLVLSQLSIFILSITTRVPTWKSNKT